MFSSLRSVLKKKKIHLNESEWNFLHRFIEFLDFYQIRTLTLKELKAYFEGISLKKTFIRRLLNQDWTSSQDKTTLRLSYYFLKKLFLSLSKKHSYFYAYYVLLKDYHPFPKKITKKISIEHLNKDSQKILAFFVDQHCSLKDLCDLSKEELIITDDQLLIFKNYKLNLPEEIETLIRKTLEHQKYLFSYQDKPLKYTTLVKRVFDLKKTSINKGY